MNNMDKENFIFNYLEGNLNHSEKGLFDEMMDQDPEFAQEVSLWKSSYFQKSNGTLVYPKSSNLLPKPYLKWVGLTLGTSVLGYVLITNLLSTKELPIQHYTTTEKKIILTHKDTVYIAVPAQHTSIQPKHREDSYHNSFPVTPDTKAISEITPVISTPKNIAQIDLSPQLISPKKNTPTVSLDKFDEELKLNTVEEDQMEKETKPKRKLADKEDIKRAYKTQRVIPMN